MLAVVAAASWVGSYWPTFRVFFAWPLGLTWSNMIASAEWIGLAAFCLWYFRERLGPALAAWWHRTQQEHLDSHMATVRAHVSSELVSFEERIRAELAAHHDRVLNHLNGNGSAGGH